MVKFGEAGTGSRYWRDLVISLVVGARQIGEVRVRQSAWGCRRMVSCGYAEFADLTAENLDSTGPRGLLARAILMVCRQRPVLVATLLSRLATQCVIASAEADWLVVLCDSDRLAL